MMNVKKIAVWGLGKHAINRILPAIKEVNGLELVGVCSRNETVVREYSKKLDCCGWTNPEDMLKKEEIDIIYLSTPIGLHAAQSHRVLLAKKHLWCEKPFTCDLVKSEELISLSRSLKLCVAESFMYLYHTQFTEIQKIIQTNKLGKIREVSLKFGFPELKYPGFRYRQDLCGGALWDVGSYTISAAYHLFKNETVDVKYVDICKNKKQEVDSDGTVILDFSGGTRVISTWHIGIGYKNEIDIWGEKGCLYSDRIFSKVDGFTPELKLRDKNGVEKINIQDSKNQFVAMFNEFLLLFGSNKKAEQERKDIIQRAMLMDKIAHY